MSKNYLRNAAGRSVFLSPVSAKVVYHSGNEKVKYPVHYARTPGLMPFLNYLDKTRSKIRPWIENKL